MSAAAPKILVTRPAPDNETSAARLVALGFDPVILPLIEMQALTPELPAPHQISALAVTSANALRALETSHSLSAYTALPLFAVGDKTASVANELGFEDITIAQGDLSSLTAILKQNHFERPVFYPHGVHVSGDLRELLRPHGIEVVAVEAYGMTARADLPDNTLDQLETGVIAAGGFYSERTSAIFADLAQQLSNEAKRRFSAFCLSEKIASPLKRAGFRNIHLADHPSEEAMMAIALTFIRHKFG